MKQLGVLIAVVLLLATPLVLAYETPSVVLTRTNPGIAGEKSAELIFSVANRDMSHKLEGYLLCRTPDDARVVAIMGAGEGDAAQYLGPLQTITEGPKLTTMTITLESETSGDKKADCQFNYIPTKTETASEKKEESFESTKDVTQLGTDVEGFIITLKGYSAAVEATPENPTATQPASVTLDVEGKEAIIEVGKEATVDTLSITVNSADEEKANIVLKGKKTVEAGSATKTYRTMQGTYVLDPEGHYSTIRLDKTVPFVEKMSNPQCPEGKTECKANEVIEVGGAKVPLMWIVIAVIVVVLIVAYLLGKTSKQ